jgi:hypothetical protein
MKSMCQEVKSGKGREKDKSMKKNRFMIIPYKWLWKHTCEYSQSKKLLKTVVSA